MKPTTKAALERLESEYYAYGVTYEALSDILDNDTPYTMPDSEAVKVIAALLTEMYHPEDLTPIQAELLKHYKARRNIKIS